MIRYTVRCSEIEHLPSQEQRTLQVGERFDIVYLLDPPTSRSPLRRVVMRQARGDWPRPSEPSRLYLLRCELVDDPPLSFRVVEVSTANPVASRADDRSFRLGIEDRIVSGQPLSFRSSAQEEVRFSLDVDLSTSRGLNAGVGGADWRRSPAQDIVAFEGWLVPDVSETLSVPIAAVKDRLAKAWKAVVAQRTTIYLLMPYAIYLGSGIILYKLGSRDKEEAEARATALQAELDGARQALLAISATESSCQETRGELANRLQDATAAAEAAAARALDLAGTLERVGSKGGAWVSGKELLALDAAWASATTTAVARTILSTPSRPEAATLKPCLDQLEATTGRVPTYVLTWSSDDNLLCPDAFTGTLGGVARAGRWALNARDANDFGPANLQTTGDPLQNDRWSAYTLANGVGEMRDAILQAEVGGRPPVAPSQADLWALTLLDAYTQLPSLASGALDDPGSTCVSRLMGQLAGADKDAAVGEPVLPDLLSVAKGAALEGVQPDAGCPWMPTSFAASAKRALLGPARLGMVQDG